MSRAVWHFLVLAGALVNSIALGWIIWRLWRWRHPLVVHMPPPELPTEMKTAVAEVIDSNAATRSHVTSVVDGMRGDTEGMKVETSKLGRIIRRVAQKFGVNVDDIE